MVNSAPPSGAVVGQHAAVRRRQQPARDRQAHAGARRVRRRRSAAIEAIEQARQVGRRQARPVIANADRELVIR